MKLATDRLITELLQHQAGGTNMTGEDLLEQLWFCYLEENRADSKEIREGFRKIDAILGQLPIKSAVSSLMRLADSAAGISGRPF